MLANLECLILNNNKIQKIENIENLRNLERLELRSNRLKKIENIENLQKLKIFTVSCNLIEHVDNLPNLKSIQEFCIFGNFLGCENDESKSLVDFETFINIIKINFPSLIKIYIGGNHFSKINNFKKLLVELLPNLRYIDGGPVY